MSDSISLISSEKNLKVYLCLLKKITLIIGYIFVASFKRSSRLGSSKQNISQGSEFPIHTRGLEAN